MFRSSNSGFSTTYKHKFTRKYTLKIHCIYHLFLTYVPNESMKQEP
jgi:hypothetical protein